MEGPKKLFRDDLREIYRAENQLIKALPNMAKYAESEELKNAFNENLQQTKEQIRRLDELFETMGESQNRKTRQATQDEGNEVAKDFEDNSALDATFWI